MIYREVRDPAGILACPLRPTQALDLPPPPVEDLLDELHQAAEQDFGDFFMFRVGIPKPMKGAPPGSLRFSVEARLAGRSFTSFALDVG